MMIECKTSETLPQNYTGGRGEKERREWTRERGQENETTERRKRTKTRKLTVLEGAAMVSISSWVTHTLPDG